MADKWVDKMLNEEHKTISDSENIVRNGVFMSRKPDKWSHIRTKDYEDDKDDVKKAINDLEIYDAQEIYAINENSIDDWKHDIKPVDEFENTPAEMVFIMKDGKDYYIVNTEGFNCGRYWVKLINFK